MAEVYDYPPFTPIDEYPMHPKDVYPNPIWACSAPERPRDGKTAYDWRCRGCVLAAQAHVAVQGDDIMWWVQTGGGPIPVERSLSWMVARSLYWFDNDAVNKLAQQYLDAIDEPIVLMESDDAKMEALRRDPD